MREVERNGGSNLGGTARALNRPFEADLCPGEFFAGCEKRAGGLEDGEDVAVGVTEARLHGLAWALRKCRKILGGEGTGRDRAARAL